MVTTTSMRRRRRSGERGAAIFVVVMAVTLLTAVGLFAAHSATVVDQAAGYARLARQTQYIAEYGTLAAVSDPQVLLPRSGEKCNANRGRDPGLITTVSCHIGLYADFDVRTRSAALGNRALLEDQSGTYANLIGHATSATSGVQGDFLVELTDPGPVTRLAGTDLSSEDQRYAKYTATTIAMLRPAGAACTEGIATMTGQQSVRAHLVLPKLQ